jgi:hypothetical protein
LIDAVGDGRAGKSGFRHRNSCVISAVTIKIWSLDDTLIDAPENVIFVNQSWLFMAKIIDKHLGLFHN